MEKSFDYTNALNQARRIENIAGELNRLARQQLSSGIETIDAGWDGASAGLMLRHCNDTRDFMLRQADGLSEAARRIRQAAGELREAELAAAAQAAEQAAHEKAQAEAQAAARQAEIQAAAQKAAQDLAKIVDDSVAQIFKLFPLMQFI